MFAKLCRMLFFAPFVLGGLWGAGDAVADDPAVRQMAALGRGVNFGGMLEAPKEGAWGLTLKPELFQAVLDGGFQTVRLPVRFSNYASATPPFVLDEVFMRRVDFAVDQALSHGLNIIIDFHHYRQMDGDPPDAGDVETRLSDEGNRDRFVALWKQIADRYKDRPTDKVLFELYNEPHGKTEGKVWNSLIVRALQAIRSSNPERFVIIGAHEWGTAWGLKRLELPANDRRLIVTIHNYAPFQFTMQGASWIQGSAKWVGTPCCSEKQIAEIRVPMDIASEWSKKNNRPIFMGEFGANSIASYPDRVTYARILREEAEARGFSWAYWDFASDEFGPWDYLGRQWREELRNALAPRG